jgi:hypothetical protein
MYPLLETGEGSWYDVLDAFLWLMVEKTEWCTPAQKSRAYCTSPGVGYYDLLNPLHKPHLCPRGWRMVRGEAALAKTNQSEQGSQPTMSATQNSIKRQ